MTRDVVPFMLYLIMTLLMFEVAQNWFPWLQGIPLSSRTFTYSLYAFTESINAVRLEDDLEGPSNMMIPWPVRCLPLAHWLANKNAQGRSLLATLSCDFCTGPSPP